MTARDGQIVAFGELLIDLIAADGSTDLKHVHSLAVLPGGAPANAAVAVSRLGAPAGFCGVVGEDPFGERLVETLADSNVDISRVRLAAGEHTSIAFAWKDARGDGHFRLMRMADVLLSKVDVDQAEVDRTAAIILGSVALSEEPSRSSLFYAVEHASAADVPICFDVNVRPTLWSDRQSAIEACRPILEQATLLKLSLDDADYLYPGTSSPEAVVEKLSDYPARFIVITDGARGAWFLDRTDDGDLIYVPAYEIEAIEPTGAGDAFTAAVVVRLASRGWESIERSDVEFASAAGAITATRPGAIASLPTALQVSEFLKLQPGRS